MLKDAHLLFIFLNVYMDKYWMPHVVKLDVWIELESLEAKTK